MTNSNELDKSMRKLSNEILLRESVVDAVMSRIYERNAVASPAEETSYPILSVQWRWIGVAAAALVFVAILFGPMQISTKDGSTWVGTSAAFAQALAETIAKQYATGITARETNEFIMNDGTRHTSQTEGKYFVSQTGYRRDKYEGDKLLSQQWYVQSDKHMIETSVRFNTKTYTIIEHDGTFGEQDPIERMQQLVKRVEKADRQLGSRIIDGTDCTGFEISASSYGNNPESWKDRIWFDNKTKLPVQIERERPSTHQDILFTISIHDQFNWNPELPQDSFSPTIPEEFLQAE